MLNSLHSLPASISTGLQPRDLLLMPTIALFKLTVHYPHQLTRRLCVSFASLYAQRAFHLRRAFPQSLSDVQFACRSLRLKSGPLIFGELSRLAKMGLNATLL